MDLSSLPYTTARLTICSTAPMTHSHKIYVPAFKGEKPEEYDTRNWRLKLNTLKNEDGELQVVIPQFGFHLCMIAAAKYSKRKIAGQGVATWTGKFTSGIMLPEPLRLVSPGTDEPILASSVKPIELFVNADGVRGSGKRVPKLFPIIPEWQTTFTIVILDPIISEEIFCEMVGLAGLFVGVGQYRPEKAGSNGRFTLEKLEWNEVRTEVDAHTVIDDSGF